MKEKIRKKFLEASASAVGFAEAHPLPDSLIEAFRHWVAQGNNAGMDYINRHIPLKSHPSFVLEGVKTVISTAFSFVPEKFRDPALPMIASYAYGDDYHDVLRHRLAEAVRLLQEDLGGEWRVCIDSAPVAERYWAIESGIGRNGRNGSVIVDKCGCMCFLAEILTTLEIAPDAHQTASCMGCGRCIAACPTGALQEDGTIDANRCLSYLTIEHRGEWTGEALETMGTEAGQRCLFGCDLCLCVCPHNNGIPPTSIHEFQPRETLLNLDDSAAKEMTPEEFSRIFKGSPVKRSKYAGFIRNAKNLR